MGWSSRRALLAETEAQGLVIAGLLAPDGAGPGRLAGGRDRAFSVGLGVSALAALPVGRWIDRHGARGLMLAASLVMAAFTLLMAGARATTGE